MQNEPNFPAALMNVSAITTKEYEKKSNWTLGENEPKTNPIQTQSNPIQSQYKANTKPIQSQFQSQYNTALRLFAMGGCKEKIMLFKSLSGKFQLIFAI